MPVTPLKIKVPLAGTNCFIRTLVTSCVRAHTRACQSRVHTRQYRAHSCISVPSTYAYVSTEHIRVSTEHIRVFQYLAHTCMSVPSTYAYVSTKNIRVCQYRAHTRRSVTSKAGPLLQGHAVVLRMQYPLPALAVGVVACREIMHLSDQSSVLTPTGTSHTAGRSLWQNNK